MHVPGTIKTLEEYLALPYRIVLTPDTDEDGRAGFVAEVAELPGCLSQGDTPDQAVAQVRDAMAGWISVALEDGIEIPEPGEEDRYSGKFLLRLPRGLHAALVRASNAEGVSLNQFAMGVLAGGIGWRSPRAASAPASASVGRVHEEVVAARLRSGQETPT